MASKSIFQDEIRENFYISGMVKRSWATQLEVLETVASICEKHNIKWYADSGTLLGTIRHGGFIPWDDDLDIAMLRDEYIRFNEIVRDELPEGYRVLNVDIEPEYNNFLTRITICSEINIGNEYLEKHNGFPYVAGIDVIPLDYLFEDEDEETDRREEAIKLWAECEKIEEDRLKPLKKLDELFSKCKEKTSRVALMPTYLKNKSKVYPVSCYADCIKMPFENIRINVPAGYDKLLSIKYGSWYKVYRNGGRHDYPFYKGQEETLVAANGNAPYRYLNAVIDESIELEKQKHALAVLAQHLSSGINEKQKVIFMVVDPDDFSGMQALYDDLSADLNNDVYIMPVPYAKRDNTGNPLEWSVASPDSYPGAKCISYDKYDFAGEHASMFIIQNPFDEYESGLTVHPFFYSSNIKKYADNLIFCHSIDMGEINLKDERTVFSLSGYVLSPGVINADLICVPSENIKEVYLKILSESDTPYSIEQWNDRIMVIGENCSFNTLMPKNESVKRIIFYTGFSDYYTDRKTAMKWLERSINIFRQSFGTLNVVWIMENDFENNLKGICSDIYDEFLKLKNDFIDYGGTVNCVEETDEIVSRASGFYGSPGYVMNKCILAGIPVMIRNLDLG